MRLKQFLSLSLSFFVSAGLCAPPLDLVLRDFKTQSVSHLPYLRFGPEGLGTSLADDHCTTIDQVFSLRSQHPVYGNRVNQDNKGFGFKCRIGKQDPMYVHMGGLINSQWGTTFITGVGKQVDLLSVEGPFRTQFRYYVGAELDALSYEWPSRRKTYYGAAPLAHQGVAGSYSSNTSGLSATAGIEQQHLPVDHIKVYQYFFRIAKRW